MFTSSSEPTLRRACRATRRCRRRKKAPPVDYVAYPEKNLCFYSNNKLQHSSANKHLPSYTHMVDNSLNVKNFPGINCWLFFFTLPRCFKRAPHASIFLFVF
uniref:Uncharacterized protein n=1 Tax=Trichogramma kaykai TaxID=54128 RepID=A0ABD2WJA7_9HYME